MADAQLEGEWVSPDSPLFWVSFGDPALDILSVTIRDNSLGE